MFNIRYKSHHDVLNIINSSLGRGLSTNFTFEKVLNDKNNFRELGIYVHTPYCDKICSFCNMNRKQVDSSLDSYADYLCREFEKYGKKFYPKEKHISTIFFGGGTPTIYKEKELEKILKALRENFILTKDYEFTFETTLHNLTPKKIEILQNYGVNRLSIGIQTFSNRGRKILNRTYEKDEIIKRLKFLRENFSGLICIDIIYNYPNETLEEIEEDAKILCELNLDSCSFYSLMVQEGSKISKLRKDNSNFYTYNLEKDKILHDKFLEITLKNGYYLLEHTKITNGKDKYKYIKNVNNLDNLIPIGVGAGGRMENVECFHLNKLITFYGKDNIFKYSLKKIAGIMQYPQVSLKEIEEYSKENFNIIFERLKEFQNKNLIILEKEYFTYTLDGIFWGNSIIADIINILIKIKNK
ncbi:MAG: coproporphyrinogen III oxidase family protein [Fusobacterium perfoetens]|uniref:coproporphyrinogen-III oxidase family protein n=1 Tax=Fusobacterium perfoetens TaxID=852 RepID=UPI0023F58AA2|nr:coproporphyrinogen-III oxidase family protein [Fusobacterium perfoetens]MCI6153154.1 coproporphyrinogen III oxidase family protein [Fusobacterium perfoetens]MDY3237084.1 coproporphyrinogen-III oxidase family protein [Fusobacterium perfoetens]